MNREALMGLRALLAAGCALISLAAASSTQAQNSFDYIHVEADSGSSSGGHAAIRFGDDVFHFQQAEPGIVRAAREPFEHFDYVYRAAGNRGLDVSRVEVSRRTYQALRDAFERRHLTGEAHVEVLASARRDRVFLEYIEALRRPDGQEGFVGPPDLQLRGTGYFYDRDDVAPAILDTGLREALSSSVRGAVATLRRHIERQRGAGYLALRAAAIDGEISRLPFNCKATPELTAGNLPAPGARFADDYARLLLGRLAIEVLLTGREPVTRAFRTMHDVHLDAADLEVLRVRAKETERGIVRLLDSRRRDWGFAMLVKLARLTALLSSIRLERLVVPDIYRTAAPTVAVAPLASRPQLASAVAEERRTDFETAKGAAWGLEASDEAYWSRMELAANLLLELRDGIRSGERVRIHEGAPVPSRDAPFDHRWPLPALDSASLSSALACARRRQAEIRANLRTLYGYNVMKRNCVTEIFATIDAALADQPVEIVSADLGAHIDGDGGLNFVPFISATAVNRSYRVTKRVYLPSYRKYWLQRCEARDCGIRARLREANTLTSVLYQPGRREDVFLLFTDTSAPLRPLAGIVNLVVGTGAALGGMLALPFDRGELLETGLRSTAVSLPELVFVNIRKGSNLLVPRDWRRTSPFRDMSSEVDAGADERASSSERTSH